MALTKVSTDGVKDDAITKSKIPANQIESSEIASGAVTSTEIADNTIVDGDIADATISLSKLEHGTSSNDGKFLRANNGADPTFETVTGTTINNNADNRVITGSGTANTLEGESNLTWDGNNLELTGTAPSVTFIDTDADDYKIHNTQGLFKITDTTASSDRFVINDNGTSYFTSNLQVGATTTSPAATICAKGTFVSILAEGTNDTTNALVASIDVKAPFYRKIGFRIKDGNNNEDLFMGRPYGTSDTNATFVMNFHGTERFRFHADGTGLCFNGDTAAANALDDYEEGTFTATCANNVTLYSGADACSYIKVGNMVTVRGQVRVSNDASNAQFLISNLPFTNNNSTEDSSVSIGSVRSWDWNLPNNSMGVICMANGHSTTLQFYSNNDSGNAVAIAAAVNAYMAFSLTYIAA